ncbi:MAG: UMP kinase, partial [Planctomycetaceae bacterium]|nr:UMP kinase [Planctomycetaceae bacterium]
EIEADILMKATKVDGVYSEDPEKNPHAVKFSTISFDDVLRQNLQVMDATAIHHCMEHKIPILVFNFGQQNSILRAVQGERVGTLVSCDGNG